MGTRSTAPVTVAEAWRAALVDNDPERALALVADDFSAPAWADRAVLSEYLRDAAARGYFSGVVVLPREIESSAAGDSVRLYPVGLRARMGTAVFELVARQDDGEWKIISANLELY